MESGKYQTIGSGLSKYFHFTLSFMSLFFIVIFYLLNVSQLIWLVSLSIMLILHLYCYIFCDVKYDNKEFVIERFLWKRKIPADKFVCISRIYVINVFIIRFNDCSFYYHGDINSFLRDFDGATDDIKSRLKAGNETNL